MILFLEVEIRLSYLSLPPCKGSNVFPAIHSTPVLMRGNTHSVLDFQVPSTGDSSEMVDNVCIIDDS